MADQPETSTFAAGVRQLETSDPVQGGVGGVSNLPLLQLASRTRWLKDQINGDQAGTLTINNRGVVFGLVLSKSVGATRNLDVTFGRVFMAAGQCYVPPGVGAAAVPGNPGGSVGTAYAYISADGELVVTDLGEQVPVDGVELATLTIPAGNVEANDPYLGSVTLTETARREPGYPLMFATPATGTPSLSPEIPGDYAVTLEPVSWSGEAPVLDAPLVDGGGAARAAGGFKIRVLNTADSVVVRWRVRAL